MQIRDGTLNETSRGMRIAIAFLGRRNAGKSSLLNALVGYDLAIVSALAGTTTDPVQKAVEINPLGPCLVIDTAGIDDDGELGQKRIEKTRGVINDSDVGVIVVGDGQWTAFEEDAMQRLQARNRPFIVALNKSDCYEYATLKNQLRQKGIEAVTTTAIKAEGVNELKQKIRSLNLTSINNASDIVGDLLQPGELAVLVVPIDLGAPKGRLILPQVQTLRDLLDHNALALVAKENQLASLLEKLTSPPALVITDSQVVKQVETFLPPEIPLTTFSTLFARFKAQGGFRSLVEGVNQIDQLEDGACILIAESCAHHAMADDIGRVKLPRWLSDYTGKELNYEIAAGPAFKRELKKYAMVIQCGGCMITPTEYQNRVEEAARAGVAISNYGLVISYIHGVLPRIIRPFPELRELSFHLSKIRATGDKVLGSV